MAKEPEPNTNDEQKQRRGVISTVFGLFAGNDSNNNSSGKVDFVNEGDAGVDIGAENANNNAANRFVCMERNLYVERFKFNR